MTNLGISAFGAYIPRQRIERATIAEAHKWMAPGLKGQARGVRAFPNWDEDSITMAVEATRDAIARCGVEGISRLRLASTHLPYADLQNAGIVAKAAGLGKDAGTSDVGGSQRAGTSALLEALRGTETTLVVASDRPFAKPASAQELSFGAGAAAFVVSSENVIAELVGSATVTDLFVDHFRKMGADGDYNWEERWVRDQGYAKIVPGAVRQALASAKLGVEDIAHLVMPSYLSGIAGVIAKQLKFSGTVAGGLEDGVGYAGAAHALLVLAATLEVAKPGERIMVIGFGQGADVLILQATEAIADAKPPRGVSGSLADGLVTDSYLRMLSFYDGIDPEWGMRSERSAKTALTEQYRSSEQMEAFNAGKCGQCGTIQFPQLQYCVICKAPSEQFEEISLRNERAKVLTSTADWLSYYPAPPLWVGFVQFDAGPRVLMEMVDIGKGGVNTDDALRMVYRIKERDRQRGYNRYFWKATPLTAA